MYGLLIVLEFNQLTLQSWRTDFLQNTLALDRHVAHGCTVHFVLKLVVILEYVLLSHIEDERRGRKNVAIGRSTCMNML